MTEGSNYASVSFESEYLNQPVVNVTLSLDKASESLELTTNDLQLTTEEMEKLIFENDIRFIVTEKNTKGFSIKLNKPAPFDIQFSWSALAIKDAKTVFSPKPTTNDQQLITNEQNIDFMPTPIPLPNPSESPNPTPIPSPTPEELLPEVTPTPEPTLEPSPSESPTPLPSADSTSSPQATPEPLPEPEPSPELTPEPTPNEPTF